MDYGYLNVASLLLGIAAIIIILTQNRFKISIIKIIISFSLSPIAIGCQIGYQSHLVNIQDTDIWDQGKGISESHIDKVFERMYTLEDSRNRLYQGKPVIK